MSRPVRGSVEDVDGSAAVFDADPLAAVVLLDDEEVAVGAVDELDDVELGADCWVLVEPDLLEEPEWPLPDELEPPRGSTYCWSPADPPPPPAMAVAGASIARAAVATMRART
jgi:hypothetical protein